MQALLGPILGIVQEGLKLWNEERRTRFMDEYHEILTELKDAENKIAPDYTDSELDLLNERLRVFLQAYHTELRQNVMETLQPKV